MAMMSKVRTKNSEERIVFSGMAIMFRLAGCFGWKHNWENPLVFDGKDSMALSAALEKALKRMQASIKDCEDPNCEIPSIPLLIQMHLAELIEWFLCFTKGKAFEIQLGEQQEYRGSKPSKVRN